MFMVTLVDLDKYNLNTLSIYKSNIFNIYELNTLSIYEYVNCYSYPS